MNKPKLPLKRRLLRLFLWLAGIAVVFVTYVAVLGDQTNFYFMAHYAAHRVPEVNIVAQPLSDFSVSHAPGTKLSYYGITFEVPWKTIIEQKPIGTITVIKFASGQVVMVWKPTGKTGFLDEVANGKDMGSPAMRAMFAEEIKVGPYAQESALLNVSTAQVRFFDPPRASARRAFLLFFKAIGEMPELSTGIYSFESQSIRGFQLGNPAQAGRIRLDFFDAAGNSFGEIVCLLGKNSSARGTQAEINRIIQTFHPIASASNNSASPNLSPTSTPPAVSQTTAH